MTLKKMKLLDLVLILSLLTISGCRNSNKTTLNRENEPGNEISRAERFTLEKKDGYTLLRIINPWQGATDVNLEYYLVKRGVKLPPGVDSSSVIYVPVKKIICMSTTYLAMISELGEEETISGVSGTGLIFESKLLDRVAKGYISEVGYEANLNKELVIKIAPDLVMIYGIGSESAGYVGKIKEMGVNVVYNADYLETDPLGKAEWIKMFGALYCKESLADSIYNNETGSYSALKSFISEQISYRPKVLLGLPFKDTWYISPGNSFISKLISDAGGDYLWKDSESSVSMPFGIENVYLKAMNADFWLNIGTVNSQNEISKVDPRLTSLPCFIRGNLYNNNKRVSVKGGNDYWESGSVSPHLILKDLASILHPDLFSNNELIYYRKIY